MRAEVVLMLIRSIMCLALSQGSPVATSRPTGLDASDLRLVRAKLRQLARPDVVFNRKSVTDGMTCFYSDEGNWRLVLGPQRGIVSFQAEGSPRTPDPDVALNNGRRIILATHPHLPEGRFLVDPGPAKPFQQVLFRQRALGYDYLNSDVVQLMLGCEGDLTQYYAYRPAPRPKAVPPKIFTVKEIEEAATRWADSRLKKDTPVLHYYATVQEHDLGWFYEQRTGRVIFAYEVIVNFMRDAKDLEVSGGPQECFFDAVTRENLENWSRRPGE